MNRYVHYILKDKNIAKVTKIPIVDGKVDKISPEKFLSPNEIVWDIIKNRLDEESTNYLKNTSRSDIRIEHLGFGMWIRNAYALWDKNNPYTDFSNANYNNHPDNLSFTIMLKVRTFLIEKIDKIKNFDEAMEILGE